MKKFCIVFFVFVFIFTLGFIGVKTNMFTETSNTASNISAKSYILIEKETGRVLKKYNENERNEIASMVKLMTSLLTIEKIEKGELKLDDTLIASDYACSMEGSEAFLNPNESYKLKDILKSVIVSSANDSAVVLSEHIAGNEKDFVKMMNEKAQKLGMLDTKYCNSTGLTVEDEQYSTAYDTALLLKEISNHKTYYEFSKIWLDKLIHKDGRETELVNTNKLIRQYDGCDIGKTGFTDVAGYCLASSAKKEDMRLISVVMGTNKNQDRFEMSKNLLNYGFTNYEMKNALTENEFENISPMEIKKANKDFVSIKFDKQLKYCNKKGEEVKVKVVNKFNKIQLPLKENDKVGTAYLTVDGKVIGEVDILTKESANKLTYMDSLNKIFNNWAFI